MQRCLIKESLGFLIILIIFTKSAFCDITVSTKDLTLQVNLKDVFYIEVRNILDNAALELTVQHDDIIKVTPERIILNGTRNITVEVEALLAGHSEIYFNSTDPSVNVKDVFLRVTVYKVTWLVTFSLVIGWIYFVAWSVSFYPQMYINWQRKSVVGLNFDFLSLNTVGFTLYSVFNLGLFFIPSIKAEYSDRFPRGLNPVQVNDIFFAVHAAIISAFTIIQCFIYERQYQRVSITARVILGIFALFLFISVILAATNVIHWLDFLYYCSYVKLIITLIKYIPQAYMNYKRKSTIGWSIGNIFLDFTGGLLSMLQMIVNSYNYNDWISIFGDPTKFGLGFFSVIFDLFFIVQHYVLYRHSKYDER